MANNKPGVRPAARVAVPNRPRKSPKKPKSRARYIVALVAAGAMGVLGTQAIKRVECPEDNDPTLVERFRCLLDEKIAYDNGFYYSEDSSSDEPQDTEVVVSPEPAPVGPEPTESQEDTSVGDARVITNNYRPVRPRRMEEIPDGHMLVNGEVVDETVMREYDLDSPPLILERETGPGIGAEPDRRIGWRIRERRAENRAGEQREVLEASGDGIGGSVEGSGEDLSHMTEEQREAYELILETRARLAEEDRAARR